MKLKSLARLSNLQLAWRRITTGSNQQYKRYYRELYLAYEVAADSHLRNLRERLLGGSYRPSMPERVYLPKSSGLHRPLTLLTIEDQVVFQAFANIAAKRLYAKRRPLQFKTVFSNILAEPDSIFFFQKWQTTYAAFQRKVRSHFDGGLCWVADFDLAAYYDTISHQLLLKTLYPRRPPDDEATWLLDCLSTWSSSSKAGAHGHGLPQGPLASDFLAECFLLPVDLKMGDEGYVRYVDDVRLLGRSEASVRARVIDLERQCRERGLIPQAGKFLIKRAQSVREALGMLPSICEPQDRDAPGGPMSAARSQQLFRKSLKGKPLRVHNKTYARYALFRAPPNAPLLRRVLALLEHQPEFSDAFFSFLSGFGPHQRILQHCMRLITSSPYAYVRGEAWQVLTGGLRAGAISSDNLEAVTTVAIRVARDKRAQFIEQLGVCCFLCASETATGAAHSRFLTFKSPLTQALAVSSLPESAFAPSGVAAKFLKRSAFEPGIVTASRMHALKRSFLTMNVAETELQPQTLDTLRELGLVVGAISRPDPIAQVLAARFGPLPSKSWKAFLGAEYPHAIGLIRVAEAAFHSSPSAWLQSQNSFNQVVFMALQAHLKSAGISDAANTHDRNGQLLKYGVMLDRQQGFSKHYSHVADCFREMNTRRNHLPSAHPYDEKTGTRTALLGRQERNRFVGQLRKALGVVTTLMP